MNCRVQCAWKLRLLDSIVVSLLVAMVWPSICHGQTFSTNFSDQAVNNSSIMNGSGTPTPYNNPPSFPSLTVNFSSNFQVDYGGDISSAGGGYCPTYSGIGGPAGYFSGGASLWMSDYFTSTTYYLCFNQAVTNVSLEVCPTSSYPDSGGKVSGSLAGTPAAISYAFSVDDFNSGNWVNVDLGSDVVDQIAFTDCEGMDLGSMSVTAVPEPATGLSLLASTFIFLRRRPPRKKESASV